MCLILVHFDPDGKLPLLLAANRDEFYRRRAEPLGWWSGGEVLAGKDLGYFSLRSWLLAVLGWRASESLGTWLGVNRMGRFAAVTNYREPGKEQKPARSRGLLVKNFLLHGIAIDLFATELVNSRHDYNGYNLLFGDRNQVWYYSNRAEMAPRRLTAGTYALSNALLDTPWYKVEKIKWEFLRLHDQSNLESVFALLADDTPAPDSAVQQTGLPFAVEKALSAPFIRLPGYGTRVSSVVHFRAQGEIGFYERTFVRGKFAAERKFHFRAGTSPAS